MGKCDGKPPCKLTSPHEVSSDQLLKQVTNNQVLGRIADGKKKFLEGPCAGKVYLGRNARKYARNLLQKPVSAKGGMTLEQLKKAFDDLFTSQMDLRPEGTYLLVDNKPVAFVSIEENGEIVSREFFEPMSRETADRVLLFIKNHLPDAHLQENS